MTPTRTCGIEDLRRVAGTSPQARLVVLFGSVATGRAAPWSDLDVAVLGLSFWDGLALGAKLGAIAGREPHVVELQHAPELLRYHIARDGVPLHEGEPGTWIRFRAEAALSYFDLAPIVELCAAGVRRRLLSESRNG